MINSVRNSVLAVLNKNNYGYISPSDFNLYAKQAQIELFEEYFSNYNKTINMENNRLSGVDYANIEKPTAEVLEYFLVSDFLRPILTGAGPLTNQFQIPTATTTGNDSYMISRIIYYKTKKTSGTNTSVATYQLIDATADFIASGIQVGDVVTCQNSFQTANVLQVISSTVLLIDLDIFQTASPAMSYNIFSGTDTAEAERVSDGRISALSYSNLTAPSLEFPAYTLRGHNLVTHPPLTTGYGAVSASYFRYPKDPKWTYVSLSGGEPAFDQSQPDYQDFEMPNEDEFKLVMKILQYCGMSIREIQVAQFAIAQEEHEQPTFSQQQ